ncbi:MAG: EutN/CcmL family microcompartment protein [Ardenticatenaceae bacterium]
MKLARVAGTVVSTVRHPFFESRRLLLCDFVSPEGRDTGDYTVAVDVVGAGMGQLVLIMDEGNGARQMTGVTDAPVRAVVAGIVDEVGLV